MSIIKPPREPKPSDDVRGPNSPGKVDPGFTDPYRNPAGDTTGAGDRAGRPAVHRDIYGFPIR